MALAKSSSSSSAGPTAEPAPAAKPKAPAYHDAEGAPSVDALLGQLRELERGVRALGVRAREEDGVAQACRCSARPPRHRQGGRDGTETADHLGVFWRSMAEMLLENGITGGAELRELLQRFLSLNAARHHHLILRAFADVWEELFAGDPTKKLKQKRPAVSPAGHGARASS
uniref:Transcription repressor n=1 Tax=Aegilops tauschii TaxID=37682 RepID=M8APK7_AEGTA